MITHKVLDVNYNSIEPIECFKGTKQECINFVLENILCWFVIVPILKRDFKQKFLNPKIKPYV